MLSVQAHRDRLMVMKLADVPAGVADRVVNRTPALPLVRNAAIVRKKVPFLLFLPTVSEC